MVKRRGVALIDVIIGSAMLAVGLGVVISMSSRSLARQTNAEKQITASWLADETLSMLLVVGPEEYSKSYPLRGRFDPPFHEYSYDIELGDESEFSPFYVKTIIAWQGASGTNEIGMETVISKRHSEEPVERVPAEPIDRELRYWEEIEAKNQ